MAHADTIDELIMGNKGGLATAGIKKMLIIREEKKFLNRKQIIIIAN
jgi:hypothetical protein